MFSSSEVVAVDMAYGREIGEKALEASTAASCEILKGRIPAVSSSLLIWDLRESICSEVRVSDCAIKGMTLVSGANRRRYSRSTGLSPEATLEN